VRLLVGGRVLGLIVVGLAMLLGRFWPRFRLRVQDEPSQSPTLNGS
jgi:hypothetical protein